MRKVLIDVKERTLEHCTLDMPWNDDSNCYNFRFPDEFILYSEELMSADLSDVTTLVIDSDLPDYSFVAGMTNLEQLYLYNTGELGNLQFIKNLINLKQLFVAESKLKSLGELSVLMKKQKSIKDNLEISQRLLYGLHAICVNSDNKLDTKLIMNSGLRVSEMIINNRVVSD